MTKYYVYFKQVDATMIEVEGVMGNDEAERIATKEWKKRYALPEVSFVGRDRNDI